MGLWAVHLLPGGLVLHSTSGFVPQNSSSTAPQHLWACVDLGIGEPNIKTNSRLLEFCLKLEHWGLSFVPLPVGRFKSMSSRSAFNMKDLSPSFSPFLTFLFLLVLGPNPSRALHMLGRYSTLSYNMKVLPKRFQHTVFSQRPLLTKPSEEKLHSCSRNSGGAIHSSLGTWEDMLADDKRTHAIVSSTGCILIGQQRF